MYATKLSATWKLHNFLLIVRPRDSILTCEMRVTWHRVWKLVVQEEGIMYFYISSKILSKLILHTKYDHQPYYLVEEQKLETPVLPSNGPLVVTSRTAWLIACFLSFQTSAFCTWIHKLQLLQPYIGLDLIVCYFTSTLI